MENFATSTGRTGSVAERHSLKRSNARLPLLLVLPFLVATLSACPSPDAGSESADSARDSVTQRERFEALEDAGAPGAQGLTGALDASDAAASRAARQDSILRGQ